MFYSISLYLILSRRSFRSFNFVFSLFFDSEGWRGRTSCEFIFSRVLSLGLVSLETGDIFVPKRGEREEEIKGGVCWKDECSLHCASIFDCSNRCVRFSIPLLLLLLLFTVARLIQPSLFTSFFLSPRTRRSHAELERRFDTWNKIRASSVSCHEPRLRRARST